MSRTVRFTTIMTNDAAAPGSHPAVYGAGQPLSLSKKITARPSPAPATAAAGAPRTLSAASSPKGPRTSITRGDAVILTENGSNKSEPLLCRSLRNGSQ
jgi:hypothetical protein